MTSVMAPIWDDLLDYIDDGRVIPIVGRELLRVQHGGVEKSLHQVLAEQLADKLGLREITASAEPQTLHDVICAYLDQNGRREDVYPRIRAVLKDLILPTPEPLKKLAQIAHFKLFVTTTFDSLLEQALNECRFGGQPKTQTLSYSPNSVVDLPTPVEQLDRPTVFHLLGKLSTAPHFAITEEDTLEFLYGMQSEKRRPEILFDELRSHHLLLIGNEFPDWLARFFIRLAKGGRLSGQRDSSEIVADRLIAGEGNLVLFLQHFSYRTRVFTEGNAVDFVGELHRRYLERHPRKGDIEPPPLPPDKRVEDIDKPLPGSVFLSYASEDRPAAIRLRDALDKVGIDVWFDRRRLESGDDYTAKVKQNIKNCSLFIPLISENTQTRLEGFFRMEWYFAVERSMQIDNSVPFILPVSIDDTKDTEFRGDSKFTSVQWTWLPDGEVSPDFSTKIIQLVREYRRRQKGTA